MKNIAKLQRDLKIVAFLENWNPSNNVSFREIVNAVCSRFKISQQEAEELVHQYIQNR